MTLLLYLFLIIIQLPLASVVLVRRLNLECYLVTRPNLCPVSTGGGVVLCPDSCFEVWLNGCNDDGFESSRRQSLVFIDEQQHRWVI